MRLFIRNPSWYRGHDEELRAELARAARAEPRMAHDQELLIEPPRHASEQGVEIPAHHLRGNLEDLARAIPLALAVIEEERWPDGQFGDALDQVMRHHGPIWERQREEERADPDHRLHDAHATLGLAQEQLVVALMREFAARGEVHRSVVDGGDIEFGLDRFRLEADDVTRAYAEAREARHAWIAVVEEHTRERGIDVDAWLDRARVRADQPEPEHGLGR